MGKELRHNKYLKFLKVKDMVDNLVMRMAVMRSLLKESWFGSEMDFQAYDEDMEIIELRLEDLQRMIDEDIENYE